MNGNVLFEIKDLQKKFGSLTVFDGLSETICKGDVVVIIGPSGGGKSTFIRCLNLLEQPTAGKIYFEGEDITAKGFATAREYGVTERMDFRLCPGLAKIKAEECDAIAIAGMGGETILGILEAAPWTHEDVHTLILQPQTKIDLLRCWLCGHGYRFLSETLVRDKEQLYVVFRVRAGMGQELSEADALTGLLLRSDPLYGEYLSPHLIKLNRARDGLAVSSLADKEARIAHLENLIEEIERRKGEWEHGNGT